MTPEQLAELPPRFASKLTEKNGCWVYHGADFNGYRRYWMNGKYHGAHRVAYEFLVGPIPRGLHLDHLCRHPACVNPDHLEPVTCRENLLRGNTFQAKNAAKTHCPQGHPYDEANTYNRPGTTERQCKACIWQRTREARAREKASR